ncbi:hypothetical protein AB1Y20_003400 [Prymnesium parvum]|uniref:Uncharacterized protein n=1 Tax=Prymnesium parvum TaxID=97485 RepID=A0AB34JCX5_PRYPA
MAEQVRLIPLASPPLAPPSLVPPPRARSLAPGSRTTTPALLALPPLLPPSSRSCANASAAPLPLSSHAPALAERSPAPRSRPPPRAPVQERINKNVNELSQKLLEGCKLLSESCPETNVPLVSTKDGRMYSVGNGCYYIRDRGVLLKLDNHPSTPSISAPPSPVPTPSRISHSAKRADVSPTSGGFSRAADESSQTLSARVAQKLLDGFTLLSESCPATNVPLVQNASGQIFSVGTNKWYVRVAGELRETDDPGWSAPAAQRTPQWGARHSTPSAAEAKPAAPRFTPAVEMPPPPPRTPTVPQTFGSGRESAPFEAARSLDGGAKADLPRSVQATIVALTSKLDEARAALVTSRGQDALPHVTLIKEIATSIGALRSLV